MSNRTQELVNQKKREISKKALLFKKVFNSDDGKEVLEMLDEEFNPEILFSKNPHETSYNTGRRDVIVYIQQLLRYDNES